jgi:hypothetical protein
VSEWQPIETAPIGVPILIAANDFSGRPSVFSVTMYAGFNIHGEEFSGFAVRGCGCQEGGTDFDAPTHWRLPPELP